MPSEKSQAEGGKPLNKVFIVAPQNGAKSPRSAWMSLIVHSKSIFLKFRAGKTPHIQTIWILLYYVCAIILVGNICFTGPKLPQHLVEFCAWNHNELLWKRFWNHFTIIMTIIRWKQFHSSMFIFSKIDERTSIELRTTYYLSYVNFTNLGLQFYYIFERITGA